MIKNRNKASSGESFVVGDQKVCIRIKHSFKKISANFLEHQQRRSYQEIRETFQKLTSCRRILS